MTKKLHVYRVAGMIASIRGKKPHVYRVIIFETNGRPYVGLCYLYQGMFGAGKSEQRSEIASKRAEEPAYNKEN